MIRTSGNVRRGFTLIELLVVMTMIGILMSAFSVSMSSAMERARIQKATSEVKSLTQAVLAYENYMDEGSELPTMERRPVNTSNVGFLLGADSQKIPVLIQAALTKSGEMRDPWGRPYLITIRPGQIPRVSLGTVQTGYYLPNFNRLTKSERNIGKESGK